MNDPPSPETGAPPAEPAKAKGRGLCMLLVIRPPISKKDISEIRRRVVIALSDSFSTVELGYYPRDSSTTHLKIMAEQATFHLVLGGVKIWYSQLFERFFRRLRQDLAELGYSILEVQAEFLTRPLPREQEGEFIPLLTRDELSALLPPLQNIINESPPVSPSPKPEQGAAPPPPSPPGSSDPEPSGKKAAPPPWIERELGDLQELSYRQRALCEYREQRPEEGIRICLEGLEKYPESPFLLYLLGTLVSSQGKNQDARQIFDHLLSTHPDCVSAYIARGRLLRRLNEETGAAQDFAKARELEPDRVFER
ncbi:MAG: hypothetical protein LUO93_01805 [Methanomicrobiales archaeon]|nr:hypothetical protein [Methanomicrobiales archaeon]